MGYILILEVSSFFPHDMQCLQLYLCILIIISLLWKRALFLAKNLETIVFSVSWHNSKPSHNFCYCERIFWSWLILSFLDWPHKLLSCKRLMVSFNTLSWKSHCESDRQLCIPQSTPHWRTQFSDTFLPLVTTTTGAHILLSVRLPGKPTWAILLPVRPSA